MIMSRVTTVQFQISSRYILPGRYCLGIPNVLGCIHVWFDVDVTKNKIEVTMQHSQRSKHVMVAMASNRSK